MIDCVKSLAKKSFDAYIEPEGDLEAVNIYKNPQRYKLKDEYEAVEALIATGKKIEFSVVARFNSKKDNENQIRRALNDLRCLKSKHFFDKKRHSCHGRVSFNFSIQTN